MKYLQRQCFKQVCKTFYIIVVRGKKKNKAGMNHSRKRDTLQQKNNEVL